MKVTTSLTYQHSKDNWAETPIHSGRCNMFCKEVVKNEMQFNPMFRKMVTDYVRDHECSEDEAIMSPTIQALYRSCSEV